MAKKPTELTKITPENFAAGDLMAQLREGFVEVEENIRKHGLHRGGHGMTLKLFWLPHAEDASIVLTAVQSSTVYARKSDRKGKLTPAKMTNDGIFDANMQLEFPVE